MAARKDPNTPSRFGLAAKRTHDVAIGIIEEETKAREEKNRRLRAARLEREASTPAPAPVAAKKPRKKAAPKA